YSGVRVLPVSATALKDLCWAVSLLRLPHVRIARSRLFARVPGRPRRFRSSVISEGMHMMRTLDNEEARRLLQTAWVARLGCIVDGEPYVVPINCHLEGDYLYSHSLAGLKITGLRENPRACVQVDEIEGDLRWRSAIAFGKYEEITKPKERADILNTLLRR